MIDIHCHLLPGVDDGSRSIEQSVSVLQRFALEGVQVVVCTPHLEASRAAAAPIELHRELLAALRDAATAAPAPGTPRLELGWEIMLDMPGVDLSAPHLALAGRAKGAVLVEFPRMAVPVNAAEELFRLRMSGVIPVVAHPERYWGCTPQMVAEWRRAGAAIQLDAAALAGSERMARLGREMLERGLVDVIAADNHGDARSLLPARRWLDEIGAGEQGHLLTVTNPGRLLDGDTPIPVAPLRVGGSGMVSRLRELVLGRKARKFRA